MLACANGNTRTAKVLLGQGGIHVRVRELTEEMHESPYLNCLLGVTAVVGLLGFLHITAYP